MIKHKRMAAAGSVLLEKFLNMDQDEARVERAWQNLQSWARGWHRIGPQFIGTLGGASQTETYLPDIDLSLAQTFFDCRHATISLATCKYAGKDQEFTDAHDFLTMCRNHSSEGCFLLAALQVPLASGGLECK